METAAARPRNNSSMSAALSATSAKRARVDEVHALAKEWTEQLLAKSFALAKRLDEVHGELSAAAAAIKAANAKALTDAEKVKDAVEERDYARAERDMVARKAGTERDKVGAERDSARAERDIARAQVTKVCTARDQALQERDEARVLLTAAGLPLPPLSPRR